MSEDMSKLGASRSLQDCWQQQIHVESESELSKGSFEQVRVSENSLFKSARSSADSGLVGKFHLISGTKRSNSDRESNQPLRSTDRPRSIAPDYCKAQIESGAGVQPLEVVVKAAENLCKELNAMTPVQRRQVIQTIPETVLNQLLTVIAPFIRRPDDTKQIELLAQLTANYAQLEEEKTAELIETQGILKLTQSENEFKLDKIKALQAELFEKETQLIQKEALLAQLSKQLVAAGETPCIQVPEVEYKVAINGEETTEGSASLLYKKPELKHMVTYNVDGYPDTISLNRILAPVWRTFAERCGLKEHFIAEIKESESNPEISARKVLFELIKCKDFTWMKIFEAVANANIGAVREHKNMQALIRSMGASFEPVQAKSHKMSDN